MSSATTGKGTIFSRGNGETPTETFTPIAEVTTFGIPGGQTETIDVSNMDSGEYREFISGFKNAGDIKFDVNFLPGNSGHLALIQGMVDGDVRNWRVEFTDAKVAATLATGTEGGNNGITWAAVRGGVPGNSITVALVNPGGTGALSVAVSGKAITVTLGRTSGTITSTAAQVITAIQASVAASALVTVDDTGASTGAVAVGAVAATNLAGGRGSRWTLPGIVQEDSFTMDPNDALKASFGIKITGTPTMEGVS